MDLVKYLKNKLKEKRKKEKELVTRLLAAEGMEIKSIGETLTTLRDEIDEVEKELEEAEKDAGGDDGNGGDGGSDEGEEGRDMEPLLNPQIRGGQVIGAYRSKTAEKNKKTDPFDTEEYRTAFMEYVCRSAPIPENFMDTRAGAVTVTGDAGAVIPTTIANEIIKELKGYGNLYAKVRKMNIQGGVEIPILSLKPEANWITEDVPSFEQKIVVNDKITFSYYGLECKIAQSLLVSVVSLSMFQELFTQLAVEAMTKAIDMAIMNGTGSGQPLGITKETRIPAKNIIELSDADITQWGTWKKAVFAKMKKSYRNGEFIMAQGTFDGYIDGMTDKNGQPIGRVNYGIDGAETYRFGGKNVEVVEDDILKPYDEAQTGDVIAVFTKLSDYIFNSNMEMKVVNWEDHDANQKKNKCILIADGKLADPYGTLIIKKKASETPTV